jgi:hypothetical protein
MVIAAPALRTVSYGGGVQSTALLVLVAQRRIDFPLFLMANVGDDSEHPKTLAYVREVAAPYAAEHGIELRLLDRVKRDGTVETLMGRMVKPGSKSLPIPARAGSSGAPMSRTCTVDFKLAVLKRELKRRGASAETPAVVAIGISTDEIHRAGTRKTRPYEVLTYPLLDLGLSRGDCEAVIARAGLPVPPKSACFFCPFHRPQVWAEQRRDEPDLFARSVALEAHLNVLRDATGKSRVYLTRFGRPLNEAVGSAQDELGFADYDPYVDGCDGEVCFT